MTSFDDAPFDIGRNCGRDRPGTRLPKTPRNLPATGSKFAVLGAEHDVE